MKYESPGGQTRTNRKFVYVHEQPRMKTLSFTFALPTYLIVGKKRWPGVVRLARAAARLAACGARLSEGGSERPTIGTAYITPSGFSPGA